MGGRVWRSQVEVRSSNGRGVRACVRTCRGGTRRSNTRQRCGLSPVDDVAPNVDAVHAADGAGVGSQRVGGANDLARLCAWVGRRAGGR